MLKGNSVSGAHNVHLPDVGHAEVVDWYLGTVTQSQSDEGFRWRRDSEDQSSAPAQGSRTILSAAPTIVNGDFQYSAQPGVDFSLPGWSHHGGGTDARWVDGRASFGQVVLFNFTGLKHNRLYVPQNADAVSLEYEVVDVSTDDTLEVYMGGSLVETLDLGNQGLHSVVIELDPRLQGQVSSLELRLNSDDFIIRSEFLVDNVAFEISVEPQRILGDANEDGKFNSDDIILVLSAGKYETGLPATRRQGDWNGDGVFNASDIIKALGTGDYEQENNAKSGSSRRREIR